ncbi:DUF3427 domain-containing protein [Lacticaseibacillus baoqingensis]|uniref:DUF3427 domain-containing protein n=1 Tax=Lacticaseibacillus baoqingensis TaxID=2486013 RepID=A0ABW4EC44_9LACO|nr:DEAD/DEAH box helicase [Lacticaseibacillus baoqingensis]
MNTDNEIAKGIHFGFIDNQTQALARFQPALVTNQNSTVLDSLEEELRGAQSFTIAVAFVTLGGLLDLKSTLADIAAHGVKGRLITSTYLGFNNPDVFADLLQIPNLDVRVFDQDGFHTKAYYFDHGEYESILIGSANLTQNALKKNFEWNLRVTSTERGDVVCDVKANLEDLWAQALPLTSQWIATYRKDWHRLAQPPAVTPKKPQGPIVPNEMQRPALAALKRLRQVEQAKKGLVVAATGTGKTYLAAFDVQQFQPQRLLFVVHREQILRKSLASFRQVLGGPDTDYGILSGTEHQIHCKYLFATVNMISKPSVREALGRDAFDYIIIDEAHRVSQKPAGDKKSMYQQLMAFYQPQFMLGMTATPERTDGTNVYQYFDYHLAYEISLLDALDHDLLAPFHYIGVTDYEQNGQVIDDKTNLRYLVSDERVNYLIAKTYYYGPREGGVHGLIFVSRVEEGRELAEKLNARGIHAQFVSAMDTVQAREKAVKLLEAGQLQYLLTVDIFNEGVDIPILNQIVMMRPTKSSIIFLQQLGRGLRKLPGKESVTVLDFIGNYDQNYMIPMAFDQSHTSNKEKIRKQIISPSISGVSTIHFEEVARKRVLEAVSKARLDDMKRFKSAYCNLRDKIGLRAPMLLDFAKFSSIAVPDIVAKFKTLYDMQQKFETVKLTPLSHTQYAFLLFLSREVAVAKRPLEAWVLQTLIAQHALKDSEILSAMQAQHIFCDHESLTSVERILNLSYFMKKNQEKYGNEPLIHKEHGVWHLAEVFQDALKEPVFKHFVADTLAANLWELHQSSVQHENRFTVGEKYYRADVIKLLNWQDEQNGQNVGGYIMRPDGQYFPIFIALEKTDQFQNKMAYEDEFLDRSTMTWFSKSGRTTASKTEKAVIDYPDFGMIQLFVKKSDDDKREGNDFYYLGSAKVIQAVDTIEQNADNKATKLIKFTLRLEREVDLSLYRALNVD